MDKWYDYILDIDDYTHIISYSHSTPFVPLTFSRKKNTWWRTSQEQDTWISAPQLELDLAPYLPYL